MKKTLTIFFLLTLQLYSQSYMNVKYNDLTYKYASINDISEITFNAGGTDMTVTLTDASSNTDALSTIFEMTFDDEILGGGSPLPVELVSFTAALTNSVAIVLNWQTATEVNNYGFEVERKILKQVQNDGESWEKIGFVNGHGNSNSPQDYTFTDINPLPGTMQYRLKQEDTDGGYKYSNIVIVESETPKEFKLAQNYPNPFNPTTEISYSLPKESDITLKVYNALGKEVVTLVNKRQEAGKYNVTFNAENLSSGIYFYLIRTAENASVKKMILLR